MKEKNKIFFGTKGITSTSANHIANIAKEVMKTEYRINRTEKYIELSDDYVMKFFASSAASASRP